MTTGAHAELPTFIHSALFYRSKQEYLGALVPFVIDGLDKDHPVLVAAPVTNLALLREALGDASAVGDNGRHGRGRAEPRPDHGGDEQVCRAPP
jgi:hypothetical protein